jgi:transcriptional regulator with XRE-family HTH domain
LAALAPLLDHDTPSATDLLVARLRAGLSQAEAATLGGVSVRAYAEQERGVRPVRVAVYRLLLIAGGRLPWAAWGGWEARGDRLYAPALRDGFGPGQITALPYLWQLVSALRTALSASRVQRSPHQSRRQVSQVACARTAPCCSSCRSRQFPLQAESRPGMVVERTP